MILKIKMIKIKTSNFHFPGFGKPRSTSHHFLLTHLTKLILSIPTRPITWTRLIAQEEFFTMFTSFLILKKHSKESEDKLFNCLSYIRPHDYDTKGGSFSFNVTIYTASPDQILQSAHRYLTFSMLFMFYNAQKSCNQTVQ